MQTSHGGARVLAGVIFTVARLLASNRSPNFVSRLFDDFAFQFEPMLLETLDYCAHSRVADLVVESGGAASLLDAGCGTGLLGAELRRRDLAASSIFGVDVSPKMAAVKLAVSRPLG